MKMTRFGIAASLCGALSIPVFAQSAGIGYRSDINYGSTNAFNRGFPAQRGPTTIGYISIRPEKRTSESSDHSTSATSDKGQGVACTVDNGH